MNHPEPSRGKENNKESLGFPCFYWMGDKGNKSHTDVIIVLLLLLTPSVNYYPPLAVWPKKVKATCKEHLSFRKNVSMD